MKPLFILFISLYSVISCAGTITFPTVNNEADLNAWCKKKSRGYFLEKKKTPYNWTASFSKEGAYMNINAHWEADSIKYQIKCRIKKGLKENSAIISISEKK